MSSLNKNHIVIFFCLLVVVIIIIVFSFVTHIKNSGTTTDTTIFNTSSTSNSELSALTPDQKLLTEKLTSLFENSTTTFQYAYIENLDDGRGYTAGRSGFTSADGEIYDLVNLYTKIKPDNILASYLRTLNNLKAMGDDSVEDLSGFEKAWKIAAEDKAFKDLQDTYSDDLYYKPAMAFAQKIGARYPLTKAFIYDTYIQHGNDGDADSLSSLVAKTDKDFGKSLKNGADEALWLVTFINIRKADLLNPHDSDTQEEWSQSTGRCAVFMQLLKDKNFELVAPLRIRTKDYNTDITL